MIKNVIFSLFPTLLLAQNAIANSPAKHPESNMNLILLSLIMLIFYFIVIRPAKNNASAKMNNIKIGDKVIINNGIKGKVVTIHSDNLSLAIEIAPNVKINVLKSGITAINPDAKAESQTKEINKSEEPKSESTKTKRKVPQRKVQKSNKPEPKNNTN